MTKFITTERREAAELILSWSLCIPDCYKNIGGYSSDGTYEDKVKLRRAGIIE